MSKYIHCRGVKFVIVNFIHLSVSKKILNAAERLLARSSTISVDVTSKPPNPLNEAISEDKTLRPLVPAILTLRYFGSPRS